MSPAPTAAQIEELINEPMPWCEPCGSYHSANPAYRASLMCRKPQSLFALFYDGRYQFCLRAADAAEAVSNYELYLDAAPFGGLDYMLITAREVADKRRETIALTIAAEAFGM